MEAQVLEVPDHDGLEVDHEVPAQRRVIEARLQQEPWRLNGPARQDDDPGVAAEVPGQDRADRPVPGQ